jgi:hypothetical protein
VGVWIGFNWFKIGAVADSCERRNETGVLEPWS